MANNRSRSASSPRSGRPAAGKPATGSVARPPAGGRPDSGPRPGGAGTRPTATSPARASFERRSRPFLVWMSSIPRWIVPALMGVMLFFGLVLGSQWAGLLLVGLALFLGWLTALSWPAITPASRMLRVVVNLAILGIGILRLLGRF